MFTYEEIPSYYIEDYKTLHHDIGLVQRTNGSWDLWFGQDKISEKYKNYPYLEIVEGDFVSATEIHSLQVGIIISCLTSWNYLNRTGNPIYTDFGNESYSLLKKNKGINTKYKIKHFFIDCLNRMRRVYSVESLDVYESDNNPYLYKVYFKVLSITNTIADGEFYIDTDASKNNAMIELNYNHPYTSVSNPLFVECVLKNEYGSFIENELIYIYIKTEKSNKFKFYGVTEPTNGEGVTSIKIPPNGLSVNTQIMFVFKGNRVYNYCKSKIINIQSVAYYIKSRYTYKIKDGKECVDKQILYVEDSLGNSLNKFRLGELLSDYVNIENITLNNVIPVKDIENNLKNINKKLTYDEYEKNKLYLIPTSCYIKGTDKLYYNAYILNNNNELVLYSHNSTPINVQLNSVKPTEIHFLIESDDNGLFEIDFNDGHLYYKIDMLNNEK